MAKAADAATDIVRGTRPDQLGLPTPCAEFTVGQVINHLIVWSGLQSERSARKLAADPALTDATDFTAGDWAGVFASSVGAATAAWGEPGALDGDTFLGGTALPARLVAAAFMSELVLHGWDVATATGRRLRVDDDVARTVHEVLVRLAPQGRELGLYGPEVAVPETASTLDRALGLAGRHSGRATAH